MPGRVISFTFNGLPAVELSHGSGKSSLVILNWGATACSWKVDGEEKMFMSPNCVYDGVKAIRGGVPVVFPQFGRPYESMPQHGFARTSNWEVVYVEDSAEEDCQVIHRLVESEATKNVWQSAAPFVVLLVTTLKEKSFNQTMHIINTAQPGEITSTTLSGAAAETPFEADATLKDANASEFVVLGSATSEPSFTFQALLHTYFYVPSIHSLKVTGYKDRVLTDKVKSMEQRIENDEVISFTSEVDRVYHSMHKSAGALVNISDNEKPLFKVESAAGRGVNSLSENILSIARKETKFSTLTNEILNVLPSPLLGKRIAGDAVVESEVVLWNAWEERAAAMSDLQVFENYVCVEPGVVRFPRRLGASHVFTLEQEVVAL